MSTGETKKGGTESESESKSDFQRSKGEQWGEGKAERREREGGRMLLRKLSIIPHGTEGMDCPTRNVSYPGTQTATTINDRLPNQKKKTYPPKGRRT